MKDKTLIFSAADADRYGAKINHQRYASAQGIDYKFEIRTDLKNPFFIKPICLAELLESDYEYILCIDDDAFFIDNSWDCTSVFKKYSEDLIVTKGRAKKQGTTLFNAGVMFIRNTDNMRMLFKKTTQISNRELWDNWKSDWGPKEGNEQPRLIYLTQTLFPDAIKILDYPGFNAHEITFKQRKNFLETNPPIVHVTGRNKEGKIQRFIRNTGVQIP